MKPWREELLEVLEKSGEQYVKGEELAEKFGFTRSALWKKISVLRSEGHPIEAITNRGYRMASRDREFEQEIREELQKNHIDDVFAVSVTDTTPSTNLLARAAGAREAGLQEAGFQEAGTRFPVLRETGHGEDKKIGVFIALQQSAGRGRRGRTWISNTQDGLWFSILLRPEVEPRTASTLTLLFGLCILKAIQSICSIPAGIKWPNDIISLQNGKKLCGILSETSMEDNSISYAVVGCGINVSQKTFPEEIQSVATSLLMEGAKTARNSLLAAVLREVAERYPEFQKDPLGFLPEYRANCATLGRSVRIESGTYDEGTAQDITDAGDLLVRRHDGTTITCTSGEVSVRGMLGYM